MTPASFSTLPPELRHQIWLLSFEPRIICLHTHPRISLQPEERPKKLCTCKYECRHGFLKQELYNYESGELVAVSFTCTAVYPQDIDDLGDVFDAYRKARELVVPKPNDEDFIDDLRTLSPGRTSLGPVQLYVCRESRAIAQTRYTLSFGGKDLKTKSRVKASLDPGQRLALQDWYEQRLYERRVWVDFNSDIIFMDFAHGSEQFMPVPRISLLWFLIRNAPEEVRMIKKLGIGGGKWQIKEDIAVSLVDHKNMYLRRLPRTRSITIFKNLEMLFVDDSFEDAVNQPYQRMRTVQKDRGEVGSFLREFLEKLHLYKSLWKEVPEVKIVRWDEWRSTTTLRLRIHQRVL